MFAIGANWNTTLYINILFILEAIVHTTLLALQTKRVGGWSVTILQCADSFDVTLSILPQHASENVGVLYCSVSYLSFVFLSMTKLARDKQVDIFLGSLIDNGLEAYDAFGLPQDAGVDHQKRV